MINSHISLGGNPAKGWNWGPQALYFLYWVYCHQEIFFGVNFLFITPHWPLKEDRQSGIQLKLSRTLFASLRVHRTARIPARCCLRLSLLIFWLLCPVLEKYKQLYEQHPLHICYLAKGRSAPCPALPHLSRVWIRRIGRNCIRIILCSILCSGFLFWRLTSVMEQLQTITLRK